MHQSSSLDFKLVQRVCLLQQALDQALSSLEELRAQVKDKQWVETQLANTEKYANVQQQAIAQLKHQLSQYVDVKRHLLSVMVFRLNGLIKQQQQEFDQLHLQFQHGHSELQAYLKYLEQRTTAGEGVPLDREAEHLALQAEVMIARAMATTLSQHLNIARQQVTDIRAELGNQHLNLAQMIKTLQAMIEDLLMFEEGSDRPPTPREQSNSGALSELPTRPELESIDWQAVAQRQDARIQELETALKLQIEHEALLRQKFQAIAAERDYYRQALTREPDAIAKPDSSSTPVAKANAPSQFQGKVQPHMPRPLKLPPSQPIQPLKLPEN
jgi:hypothetical protein